MTSNLSIVLVETSHPGNIGAAARAMRTMGLRQLVLVAPDQFPHREASAMAAGADDVLASARICADLEEALADCRLVLGCTARQRSVPLPEHSPRAAAGEIMTALAAGPVALVFGRERTGLTNAELQRCHAAIHIPSDPEFGSLNLAAAVQVLSYELRLATLQQPSPAALVAGHEAQANQSEMEGLFGHLQQTLDDIDFHKGRAPHTVMQRLRRIFLRASLDPREVRILRGILSDAQRMARLARESGAL